MDSKPDNSLLHGKLRDATRAGHAIKAVIIGGVAGDARRCGKTSETE